MALSIDSIKVFNGCAGIGGNAFKWDNCEVVAVENEPKIAEVYKKLNPTHTVIVGDAYEYFKNHHQEFNFAWWSPPCQKHSKMMKATRHNVADYPDFKLYEVIVFCQHFFKGKWVVENVIPYYEPLIKPTAKLQRHLFWSNFDLPAKEFEKDKIRTAQIPDLQRLHGIDLSNYKISDKRQILRNCVHAELGKYILECLYES
mgnify:CR=1 FL=1